MPYKKLLTFVGLSRERMGPSFVAEGEIGAKRLAKLSIALATVVIMVFSSGASQQAWAQACTTTTQLGYYTYCQSVVPTIINEIAFDYGVGVGVPAPESVSDITLFTIQPNPSQPGTVEDIEVFPTFSTEGVLPFSISSPSLYLTVSPGADGGVSLSGQPTDMIASAIIATTPPTPNSIKLQLPISLPTGTTTIQEAANALGYTALDWQQAITVPQLSPFYECTDIQCTLTHNIGGTFLDPPQYGYNYCNPNSSSFDGVFDCSENYPYYYSLMNAEDNPGYCILILGIGSCGLHLISPDGTTLSFFDAPADPDASTSNPLSFTTGLVGIENGGQDVVLGAFDWIDTFDGLSGGIATTFNEIPTDPGSGTGGITLISINGVPVGSGLPVGVPEPGAVSLLCAGLVAFALIRRRKLPT